MSTLTDPLILAQFHHALANWNVTGYVEWKPTARNWLKSNLPSVSQRDVARMLFEYVRTGGSIDQVRETRPEWNYRDFHYDFRFPIAGKAVYVETILIDDEPADPIVEVVNIHDA